MKRPLQLCLYALLLLGCPAVVFAQETPIEELAAKLRTNGGQPAKALRERFESARSVTVRFHDGNANRALGTVVDPSGLVLAKLSDVEEISGLKAVLGNMNRVPARIVARDAVNDLALVKVEAEGLPSVSLEGEIPELPMGTMLYALGHDRTLFRIGVVSALAREIKKPTGKMGVIVGKGVKEGGVRIREVLPQGGAAAVGVKAGDIMLAVNGEPVEFPQDVTKLVDRHFEGETITVRIRREEDELELNVKLSAASKLFEADDVETFMPGEISGRVSGFERVIQHDMPLDPQAMGGPVWDLDGHLVGINIARVNRVTTYALSLDVVKKSVAQMRAEAAKSETKK